MLELYVDLMSSSITNLNIIYNLFLFGSWEIKTSFKKYQSSLQSKSVYSFTKSSNIPGNYSSIAPEFYLPANL